MLHFSVFRHFKVEKKFSTNQYQSINVAGATHKEDVYTHFRSYDQQ